MTTSQHAIVNWAPHAHMCRPFNAHHTGNVTLQAGCHNSQFDACTFVCHSKSMWNWQPFCDNSVYHIAVSLQWNPSNHAGTPIVRPPSGPWPDFSGVCGHVTCFPPKLVLYSACESWVADHRVPHQPCLRTPTEVEIRAGLWKKIAWQFP
jgi:hypothetical protein